MYVGERPWSRLKLFVCAAVRASMPPPKVSIAAPRARLEEAAVAEADETAVAKTQAAEVAEADSDASSIAGDTACNSSGTEVLDPSPQQHLDT